MKHKAQIFRVVRETKTCLGVLAEVESEYPIADSLDAIWHLCNWGSWEGSMLFKNNDELPAYEEDRYYRVREDDEHDTIHYHSTNRKLDSGYADHDIVIFDSEELEFHVAQSFGWKRTETLSAALDINYLD